MSIDTDEKVANCILKLSDLMRYSLYQTGKDLVSLTEEVEFIKNYIDLEKIRLSQRASIKIYYWKYRVRLQNSSVSFINFRRECF